MYIKQNKEFIFSYNETFSLLNPLSELLAKFCSQWSEYEYHLGNSKLSSKIQNFYTVFDYFCNEYKYEKMIQKELDIPKNFWNTEMIPEYKEDGSIKWYGLKFVNIDGNKENQKLRDKYHNKLREFENKQISSLADFLMFVSEYGNKETKIRHKGKKVYFNNDNFENANFLVSKIIYNGLFKYTEVLKNKEKNKEPFGVPNYCFKENKNEHSDKEFKDATQFLFDSLEEYKKLFKNGLSKDSVVNEFCNNYKTLWW